MRVLRGRAHTVCYRLGVFADDSKGDWPDAFL
jgi:hypothetical protein